MKIDANNLNSNIGSLTTDSADAVRLRSGSRESQGGGAGSNDTVQLSSDAQFAERLRQAINTEPVIRQDKVDDARRKLESGALGQDADALAGRLIDHLLEG